MQLNIIYRLFTCLCLLFAAALAQSSCPGIVHKLCCCPRECGKCGGANCENLPGGPQKCCCNDILQNNSNICSEGTAPPCVITPKPSATVNKKRGFVADYANCDDAIFLNVSGWYYDYNMEDNYRKQDAGGKCGLANATANLKERFVPMNWCLSGMRNPIPEYVNRTFFMGFNEPNNLHNCKTDAESVATAWHSIMQRWKGSRLVSPATAGNGTQFFDDFFGNCSKMYGQGGCNISYLAVHDYSCTPEKTMSYLKSMYDRYGYKIWLTEFSCGDAANHKPTSEHVEYMLKILPLLDSADYIYRYSWMSTNDKHGLRGLLETINGTRRPTVLGHIWNS